MMRHARSMYQVQRERWQRAVVATAIASGTISFVLGWLAK